MIKWFLITDVALTELYMWNQKSCQNVKYWLRGKRREFCISWMWRATWWTTFVRPRAQILHLNNVASFWHNKVIFDYTRSSYWALHVKSKIMSKCQVLTTWQAIEILYLIDVDVMLYINSTITLILFFPNSFLTKISGLLYLFRIIYSTNWILCYKVRKSRTIELLSIVWVSLYNIFLYLWKIK